MRMRRRLLRPMTTLRTVSPNRLLFDLVHYNYPFLSLFFVFLYTPPLLHISCGVCFSIVVLWGRIQKLGYQMHGVGA